MPVGSRFALRVGEESAVLPALWTSRKCVKELCYGPRYPYPMATISHRELRNNSAEILRRVAAGEAMVVTNHGEVVAYLSPAATPSPHFPVSRPARRTGGWSSLPKVTLDRSVNKLIDDEREDRI